MWPYTQDEVKWLASQQERAAVEKAQRAIDEAWMAEIGVRGRPANDVSFHGIRMIDPRR